MPIFNYKCQSCNEDFEYFIVRSDDYPHCPKCASKNLKKQVSLFSIGSKSEKIRTMNKVDKVCSKMEKPQTNKQINGCARGYANKVLANYKR